MYKTERRKRKDKNPVTYKRVSNPKSFLIASASDDQAKLCFETKKMEQKKAQMQSFFVSADQDRDSYETGSATYYLTQALLIVYGIGFIASCALLLNAQVKYTHTLGNVFGPLYSDRYVTQWWWSLFFAATRIFMFMCVCSLLLYRKTATWCNIFWMIPIFLLLLMDVAALLMLSGYFATCNSSVNGNFNNPCNSLNWCCDARIYTNPAQHCRPTSPCPPGQAQTLEQMRPNVDFLWLFSINVVSVAFGLYFLALPAISWLGISSSSNWRLGGTKTMDAIFDRWTMKTNWK